MPSLSNTINTANDELRDYVFESSRPLANLLFIAPLLIFYELTATLQPGMVRSATETWFHLGFQRIGLPTQSNGLVLALLVCGAIALVHFATQRPWKLPWRLMPAMSCEAILGGILLIALLQLIVSLTSMLSVYGQAPPLTIDSATSSTVRSWIHFASFIGAGLYEEIFFRAMIITPIARCLRRLGETRNLSWTAAVVMSSLLFALAHYHCMNIAREPFDWFSFSFRFSAGIVFSLLYILRGLGITVGAHITYDVLIASGQLG